ncbi:MAG: Hsp33 family molecular chaperone HslO [bacterium]|nr:Hsp33 family molecular chaperone HslO [bacterium]
MIKTKLEGKSTKELLKAKARDRLYHFMLADGKIRAALVNTSLMVNEMRANHGLGILETLVLGHAYTGGALLTATLKGNDRMAFKVDCGGPIKGLSVEINAHGEVRGFLKNVPIPVDAPLENNDLSKFFGTGLLQVTRFPEHAKQPYTGNVVLRHGNIALDLADYFMNSEQTPTAFNLSIKFDEEGTVLGAGGLMLQAMPDAGEAVLEQLETMLKNLPCIGEFYTDHEAAPETFMNQHFKDLSPKLLGSRRVEFFCRCRKESVGQMVGMLPPEDIEDMLKNGPFPVEIKCHNCSTMYSFDKEEIQTFAKKPE